MNRTLTLALVFLGTLSAYLVLASMNVDAETVVLRSTDTASSDAPSGTIRFRIAADGKGVTDESPQVPLENGTPPTEPNEPGPEEETPTFFGENVGKKVLWVLDCSCSMHHKDVGSSVENWDGSVLSSPSRLDIVKAESIRALVGMDASHEIDFILLAGNDTNEGRYEPPVTNQWRGELVQADDDTLSSAIDFIANLPMWWGTPTHTALHRACTEWGNTIDTLFFLSDGAPTYFDVPEVNSGPWESIAAGNVIVEKFPDWFSALQSYGCELVCIHIGNNPRAGQFMQNLSTAMGAKYVKR